MTTSTRTAPRAAFSTLSCCAIVAVTLGLTGCETAPVSPAPAAAPAPAIEPLQQMMQRAGEAGLQGSKDRAREIYSAAAKTYPTSKEPWLKLAQDYFENRNYGQAILAAQEVRQRDPTDDVATGILAVSGLRVSADGLSAMRQQQRRLNGDNRREAEEIVRKLRELLGELVLVPSAPPESVGAGRIHRPLLVPPRTTKPTVSAAPAPVVVPPKGTSATNPFK